MDRKSLLTCLIISRTTGIPSISQELSKCRKDVDYAGDTGKPLPEAGVAVCKGIESVLSGTRCPAQTRVVQRRILYNDDRLF